MTDSHEPKIAAKGLISGKQRNGINFLTTVQL